MKAKWYYFDFAYEVGATQEELEGMLPEDWTVEVYDHGKGKQAGWYHVIRPDGSYFMGDKWQNMLATAWFEYYDYPPPMTHKLDRIKGRRKTSD